jgi:hypothetical protein
VGDGADAVLRAPTSTVFSGQNVGSKPNSKIDWTSTQRLWQSTFKRISFRCATSNLLRTDPSSFKSLQQTLNKLGFVVAKTGPGSIGNETNVFGNATKEALIKFQIEYGIIKNANSQGAGVYGPKTKEKIAELAK